MKNRKYIFGALLAIALSCTIYAGFFEINFDGHGRWAEWEWSQSDYYDLKGKWIWTDGKDKEKVPAGSSIARYDFESDYSNIYYYWGGWS